MIVHRAFTLIEVLAVVALLGLLAAATTWSLAGPAERATRDQVIDQIAHTDRIARLMSQRTGRPVQLAFDLDQQQMVRRIVKTDGTIEVSHTIDLPSDIRLTRIVLPAKPTADAIATQRPGHHLDRGTVQINYATQGRSASYGLCIENEQDVTYLVFAGLSGHMTQTDDSKEVDNLFALLTRGRPDAD